MARAIPRILTVALLGTACLFLVLGCLGDAPRDNPLDPESGVFDPVFGRVLSLFEPHRPLGDVEVGAPNFEVTDSTDADGVFELLYLPPEQCLIVAEGAEFQPSSLYVAAGASRKNLIIYLNTLPQVDEASIVSTYQALWYPEPYRIWTTVSAVVGDSDGPGDVDSVVCILRDGVRFHLAPSVNGDVYSIQIDDDELGEGGIEGLVGFEGGLQAWDGQGASSTTAPLRLVRVIRDVATLSDPVGLEEVGVKPMLHWTPAIPFYEAAQRVKIIRTDNGVETDAWESPLVTIETDSLQVSRNLMGGTYYWVVFTVDLFGNRGRSREAAFTVGDDS